MSTEAVAKWMIDRGYATSHGDTIEDLLKELEWQIRESEREACAKVCEDESGDGPDNDGCCPTYWNQAQEACATAIRERGNK